MEPITRNDLFGILGVGIGAGVLAVIGAIALIVDRLRKR